MIKIESLAEIINVAKKMKCETGIVNIVSAAGETTVYLDINRFKKVSDKRIITLNKKYLDSGEHKLSIKLSDVTVCAFATNDELEKMKNEGVMFDEFV